ncbi:MAG: polysaccharide deacetylase family protein [Myxococcaceae bacterium]
MRLASVSVDLDSLPYYYRIHGLDEGVLDARARRLVYSTALPRLLEVFGRAGVPSTLFAIGEDLSDGECAGALSKAAAGHEVASHSHRHDYALSRLPEEEIARDLSLADAAILRCTGRLPEGFRAPGYTLSAPLYRALCARGYRYGSSAFGAAPYYLAKAMVMGALQLWGRPSRAVLDSPGVMLAPRVPYRPDPQHPYRRGDGPVLELPVAVTPLSRFPFIGTFALTLPRPVVRGLYRTLRGDRLLNLELHGIDALDESDGVPPALCRVQPEQKVSASQRLLRLEELLRWLKEDFEVCTLAAAARRPGLV